MNTNMNTASANTSILAIDLGKYKSVACVYDSLRHERAVGIALDGFDDALIEQALDVGFFDVERRAGLLAEVVFLEDDEHRGVSVG